MCGRAALTYAEDELVQLYTRVARRERQAAGEGGGGVEGGEGTGAGGGDDIRWLGRSSFRPSPNVAPTSSLPVLSRGSRDDGDNESSSLAIETMRWGIHTSSPTLPFLINARSETAASLASFSRLLASRSGRGVLAVEGFYEWKEASSGKKKQPFFVRRTDGKPMLLAVLIERGNKGGGGGGGAGDVSSSPSFARFVVLTRAPPTVLRWLHDRAPCILPTEGLAREWLLLSPKSAGGTDASAAAAATKVLSEAGTVVEQLSSLSSEQGKNADFPLLSWHPVTPEMGKTSYQRDDASRDIRKGGIASLFGKAAAATATAVKKEAPSPSSSPRLVNEEKTRLAKEEKTRLAKEDKTTTPPPPSKPHLAHHSGVKREHDKADVLTQAASKKKTKTTTTPAPRGQRSLDAFFSPKQKEKQKA